MAGCSENNCTTKVYALRLCRSHYKKQWAIKTDYYKKNYSRNQEKIKAYTSAWYKTSKGKALRLRQDSGIDFKKLEEMMRACGNRCEICGKEPPQSNRLCVDHCHKTNLIRGLLCRACNMGLGSFRDNTEFLQAAIRYLEK